jgi:hypothetical protein
MRPRPPWPPSAEPHTNQTIHTMKALSNVHSTVPRSMLHAFAAIAILVSADPLFAASKPATSKPEAPKTAAPKTAAPKAAATSTERRGTVKYTSPDENIDAQIVIHNDGENFVAEITKSPGTPLLKITAKFGTDPKATGLTEKHMLSVHVSGPLSHGGGWTWKPSDLAKKNSAAKLKDHSHVWGALPEVFMWGEAHATGDTFRVCMPDIVIHGRAGGGEVLRFDYARHENPTGEALTLKDLRKQPVLESVICHLDK